MDDASGSKLSTKKEARNPSKKRKVPSYCISKAEEKAYSSGCMCFISAKAERQFVEKLNKQKLEDNIDHSDEKSE